MGTVDSSSTLLPKTLPRIPAHSSYTYKPPSYTNPPQLNHGAKSKTGIFRSRGSRGAHPTVAESREGGVRGPETARTAVTRVVGYQAGHALPCCACTLLGWGDAGTDTGYCQVRCQEVRFGRKQ